MFTPILTLLVTALKKVSHNIARDFNEIDYLRSNGQAAYDFALKADANCKKNLHKDLAKFKNNYSFLIDNMENIEAINNKDTSNYFILHGILGIKNFAKAIPSFVISVSLQRDSEIIASTFYNPITSDLFYAEKGEGAYHNQKRLRPNNITNNINPIIVTDKKAFNQIDAKKWQDIRIHNCNPLDLCYIAAGKYSCGVFLNPEDTMQLEGALLLAKEAGVVITKEVDENKKITSLSLNI